MSKVSKVFTSLFVSSSSAGNCDGFEPSCICSDLSPFLLVFCDAPISTLKSIFSKTKVKSISSLYIAVNFNDSIIPANLTGNVKISNVEFICPIDYARPNLSKAGIYIIVSFYFYLRVILKLFEFNQTVLSVHLSAFGQSKLVTEGFGIGNCDLSKLNWGFLGGFTKLRGLKIDNCNNFATTFNTFPSTSLTALSWLNLEKLSDLNKFVTPNFKYPAVLKNGLTQLTITDVVYPTTTTDTVIQNFLANWITPSSRKTLTDLRFDKNSMTKIPSEVVKYNNLTNVIISRNTQPLIVQSNAFNITKNLPAIKRWLYITSSKITSIQPGAFQGNY